jgi:hypothetical protein
MINDLGAQPFLSRENDLRPPLPLRPVLAFAALGGMHQLSPKLFAEYFCMLRVGKHKHLVKLVMPTDAVPVAGKRKLALFAKPPELVEVLAPALLFEEGNPMGILKFRTNRDVIAVETSENCRALFQVKMQIFGVRPVSPKYWSSPFTESVVLRGRTGSARCGPRPYTERSRRPF